MRLISPSLSLSLFSLSLSDFKSTLLSNFDLMRNVRKSAENRWCLIFLCFFVVVVLLLLLKYDNGTRNSTASYYDLDPLTSKMIETQACASLTTSFSLSEGESSSTCSMKRCLHSHTNNLQKRRNEKIQKKNEKILTSKTIETCVSV